MTLAEKLEGAVDGLGLYGLSPPRLETPEDRQRELADQQRARIERLGCDGLVVYDIQDEGEAFAAEKRLPIGFNVESV